MFWSCRWIRMRPCELAKKVCCLLLLPLFMLLRLHGGSVVTLRDKEQTG